VLQLLTGRGVSPAYDIFRVHMCVYVCVCVIRREVGMKPVVIRHSYANSNARTHTQ
jgi:hypothetical protein